MELLLKRIDGEDELSERRLVIDHNTTIQIGRASKTEQKQLIPAISNGWIRNPVISRSHAILTLEPSGMTPAVVFIQDKKSSHGTFVNGDNIKDSKYALKSGDEVRFGSEVMRGEETFRPPVFKVEIGFNSFNPPSSSNITTDAPIMETTTSGTTIKVPEESGAESEGEDDMPSEEAMSSRASGSFLGSQKNPWTIDEDIDEEDLIPDSELIKAAEDAQDDDASSESNISDLYDEDVEFEDRLLDMEEEGEDPMGMSDEEDESEIEDHDSEDIAESPIYTPKSPRYVPGEAESSFGVRGYTPPPQFGNDAGYIDGPFINPYGTWARVNDGLFAPMQQPWGMEPSQPSVRIPAVFPIAIQQADLSAQQHSAYPNGGPLAPVPATSKVVSTSDLVDQNRRTYNNKENMSIEKLINPPLGKELSIAGTKRKANELEAEGDDTMLDMVPVELPATAEPIVSPPAISQSNAVADKIDSDKLPQTPESLDKEPSETPAPVAVVPTKVAPTPTAAAGPPRKKLRTMVAKAALFGAGVMVGSAGMLGGLMSLPDGFFQS